MLTALLAVTGSSWAREDVCTPSHMEPLPLLAEHRSAGLAP
jgi:hypothetical protein